MGEPKIRIPVWAREPKPAREPRRQLRREDIVEAAVLLADSEGLEAVSIRKLAGELGTRPMSLYRHIDSRDELLELMYDDVIIGDRDITHSGSWRTDLCVLAHRMRAITLKHPWAARMMGSGRPMLGPNGLLGLEWSFEAVNDLGLSIADMSRVVFTFIGVVNSALRSENVVIAEQHRSEHTIEEWEKALAPYIEKVISGGEHPLSAQFFTTYERDAPEDDFNAKIAIVLDGLEKYVHDHSQS